MRRTRQWARMLAAVAVGALMIAATATVGAAIECDANAIATLRYFLEARDKGEYRVSQRYLSPQFGQNFRTAYGAAYLDYMGDPDVTWSGSVIQSSALLDGACTAQVSSTRHADGTDAPVAETYRFAATYLGWRIDAWQWQGNQ